LDIISLDQREVSGTQRSGAQAPRGGHAMQEHYARTITRFEYVSFSGNMRDQLRCRDLPGLGLADVTSFGASTRRTAQHLVNDDLSLYVTLSGKRMVRQCGREGIAEAGDALLSDGTEPSEGSVTASRFMVFRLPRKAIATAVPDLGSKVARPIRRDCEALRLLTSYADVLRDAHALASAQVQRLAVGHVYNLVALSLGTPRDASETGGLDGVRAARRQAVLAEIKANFSRPAFSPRDVASKLGLSPRYIQTLLHESGASFTEHVLELRLQKARSALLDPLEPRSVSDIALDCGFGDISYFNHRFRCRFGDTPTGVRIRRAS
jgi:AraC-like DNA-binding protein